MRQTVSDSGNGARYSPSSQIRYTRSTLNQLSVLSVISIAAFMWDGRGALIGVASGAICQVLPQAFFALRMQRAARMTAQRAARLGLAAETGKFLLSAVCFALVFAVLKPERPGLVFLGFVILWMAQLLDNIRMVTRAGDDISPDRG